MKRLGSAAVMAALLIAVPISSAEGANRNPNPGVLPPGAAAYGKTYGEWSAEWWIWALEAPRPVNPLGDPTGANCAEGQAGKVWFLAGTLGGGAATRSCTIPTGTALFFPIVNSFAAEEGSVESMRAALREFIDSVDIMSASVDGKQLVELFEYRAVSPVFSFELPTDNIFDAPPGRYDPAVSDGYWLMLRPLSPGDHEIRFAASADDLSLDVTYDLTVTSGRNNRSDY